MNTGHGYRKYRRLVCTAKYSFLQKLILDCLTAAMAVRRLLGAVLTVSLLKLSTGQVFPYKEEFFDQTIDHFNFVSYGDKTFKQRYLFQGKASIQR